MTTSFKSEDINDLKYNTDAGDELLLDSDSLWVRPTHPEAISLNKLKSGQVAYPLNGHVPSTGDVISITQAGVYAITVIGAGGGAAITSYGNMAGTYGGAAIAAGGSGGYVQTKVNLTYGDTLTITVGNVGRSVSKVIRGLTGNFDFTGTHGGNTIVHLHGTRTRKTGSSSSSTETYEVDEDIIVAEGGKRGRIILASYADGAQYGTKDIIGGAGGSGSVNSTFVSGWSKATILSGATGSTDHKFDLAVTDNSVIDCYLDHTGSHITGYGNGAGGSAWKHTSKQGVDMGCKLTNSATRGDILIVYDSGIRNGWPY